MKIFLLAAMIALLLIFGACGQEAVSHQTATQIPTVTPISTPTPPPTPDFSAVDFSGMWLVGEVIDSEGQTISESKMRTMNGDFILELLRDSVYFVYDETGIVLGQGAYRITLNQLTLTASGKETTYEIQDKDTLCCTVSDGSKTVMKRVVTENEQAEPSASDSIAPDDADENEDTDTVIDTELQ